MHRPRTAEQPPLRIGRDFDIPQLIALLRGREEMLGAVLDPFDGSPKSLSRERNRNLFRIHCAFRPEATADIGRDDTDGTLVAAEMRGHQAADHVRRLRRGPDSQMVGDGIDRGDHRPSFHGMAASTMRDQPLAEYMRRLGKDLVNRPEPRLKTGHYIIRRPEMCARRAWLKRVLPVHDGREDLIFDNYFRSSVFGQSAAVSDDHRYRNADMAHLVIREHWIINWLLHHGDRHHVWQRLSRHIAKIS